MAIFGNELETKLKIKINEFNRKIKNSFEFIRQDIDEMQKSINAMKNYLKKREKQEDYAKKQDNKIRTEFRKDVDEFNQKIKQLRLALEKVNEINKNIVVKSDLARIEDQAKSNFKEDIKSFKNDMVDFRFGLSELTKRTSALEKDFSKLKEKSNREKKNFFGFFTKGNQVGDNNP